MAETNHQFNFFRKIWHILGLVVPACLYGDWFAGSFGLAYASRAILVSVLGGSLFLLLVFETIRLNNPKVESFFYQYFGFLMKESERARYNGTVPYFLANLIVVLFFPAELSILSILFLIVGDPAAAYFGAKYGKRRFYNGKSLEGVFGFLVGAFIAGISSILVFTIADQHSFLSVWKNGEFQYLPILLILVGETIACLTEFFCPTTFMGLVDDNLLIPVVSGISILLFCIYLFPAPYSGWIFPPMDLYLRLR